MTDEQAKINEIFETYLESYFSPESKQRIAQIYGEEMLSQVLNIYDAILASPVDWRTATMNDALDTMHRFITENYPWLSNRAQSNVNHAFIMTWK